jgi:hypothetical protein
VLTAHVAVRWTPLNESPGENKGGYRRSARALAYLTEQGSGGVDDAVAASPTQ